jgi:hydroxymethylpyrimidine pyrophosphatase-like HAD family hydrolase
VLCGKRSAYVERPDERFLANVRPYYAQLAVVDDLLAVRDDEVLKVAVYDFGAAETGAGPALAALDGPVRSMVSQEHWVDVMSPTADKGAALEAVQRSLGITRDQTMAFGDYLNDLGMLRAAAWSFAMDNAHPSVRAEARFVAPGNNANGVVRTVVAALALRGVLAA